MSGQHAPEEPVVPAIKPSPRPFRQSKAEKEQMAKMAQAAMKMSQVAVESARQHVAQVDDPTKVYFLQCPRGDCLGPAIWLHKRTGAFSDNDWESSYHPRGASWPYQVMPHCQCCAERGLKTPLRIFLNALPGQVASSFVPNPRFIKEMDRREFETLTIQEES